MSKTTIAWTDESLNPIVGCTKVSPGCSRCYAETAAASPRLQQFEQYKTVIDEHGHWNGHVDFVPRMLDKLFTYKKPRRIFMPSMSDPFHPAVKDEWLDQMMAAIALNPHLTFQVLTKRPERMKEYMLKLTDCRGWYFKKWASTMARLACEQGWRESEEDISDRSTEEVSLICHPIEMELKWKMKQYFLPNLHLGVTVENQASAGDRISLLLQTPAAVRFLSVEPMLEEIDISRWTHLLPCPQHPNERASGWGHLDCDCREWFKKHVKSGSMSSISWVIIGGESGSNARPFNLEWAELIINQCKEAEIPVFMKQVGSNAYYKGDRFKTKSRAGTDPSEWPEHLRVQEFPNPLP
ncbi:MAG: DUF5131 family protein [Alphaproteobacteria bacterium]